MFEFACDFDRKTILITIVVCIVIVILMFILIFNGIRKIKISDGSDKLFYSIEIVIALLLPLIILIPFLSMPRFITISEDEFIINKVKGSFNIPIDSITEIRMYTSQDDENTIRTMASGGFFGYIGTFKNPQLGDFKQYSVNLEKRILIKTTSSTWVVSSEEPNKLIEVVKERI